MFIVDSGWAGATIVIAESYEAANQALIEKGLPAVIVEGFCAVIPVEPGAIFETKGDS